MELGIDGTAADRLESLLAAKPAIATSIKAKWVKPELFCVVQFAGWRPGGWWRDAAVVAWGE